MAFLDPYDLETMGNILNWNTLYNSNLQKIRDAIGQPCFSGTAGENLSAGEVVCVDTSDGKVYKADADNSNRMPAVGIVFEDASAGSTVWVQFAGKCSKFSGLTTGALYYVSTTAGALTTSPPSNNAQIVGRAISDTTLALLFVPPTDQSVIDHGNLSGLSDDDHSQYVHTSTARTISAQHTFNPTSAGAPFVLGANASGQLVTGLNADLLDGKHATTQTGANQIPATDANGYLKLAGRVIVGATTSPHSHLQSEGSVARGVASVSTDTTLDETYSVVLVDASGGTITISLPQASGCKGRQYVIKKTDSSSYGVVVDPYGTETIDGSTTRTISTQWGKVEIVSDGSNWYEI